MKIKKIFNKGKILNKYLYLKLQELELNNPAFLGCGNEFMPNRDWWVYTDKKDKIIAYCGSVYSENICIFNRAWVKKEYRGKGLHKRMIAIRLMNAKRNSNIVITYTINDNFSSANNLINFGFKLYEPQYKYGGDVLYFMKKLK